MTSTKNGTNNRDHMVGVGRDSRLRDQSGSDSRLRPEWKWLKIPTRVEVIEDSESEISSWCQNREQDELAGRKGSLLK